MALGGGGPLPYLCFLSSVVSVTGCHGWAALFDFPHQSLFTTTSFLGCIAQLVEHWAFNLMVAGSSPAIPKPNLHYTMSKDA